MQIDWLNIIDKVFDIAVIPILALLTVYVIVLIKTKKQQLIAETDSEIAKKYINMLDQTISECVLATNQTYVEALKKQGSFDLEAQQHAFKLTYEAVMAILTEDAKEYLNESISDLSTYITTKIESQVVMAKQLG